MAAAAALAVQDVIRRDGLLANVVAMAGAFNGASRSALGKTRSSATFAGAGSFGRSSSFPTAQAKRPFDPALKLHARVKREAMARGLMVYPMGGTIDGVAGDHVLMAPPFIVEAAEVDAIVERLGSSLEAALAGVR